MSIRPVEFSGVVQRSQDMSAVKQNEDNKPMLQQHNVQTHFSKETQHHMQQVNHAHDSDNPKKKFDAKEKGSNEYESRRKKKKKAAGKESSETVTPRATFGGFDMKI
ncbi:hypothetical protein AALC25_00355 [Lachnospiraceae bacterium 29-84]